MEQQQSPRQPVSSTFLMDASLAPLKRSFERLSDALHERLPFFTAKTAHTLSTVFEGSRYDLGDQQEVVVESESSEEKSYTKPSDRLPERLSDEHDQYEDGQEHGMLDYEEDQEHGMLDNEEEECDERTMENVAAYLVVCGVLTKNVGLRGLRNTERARFVSIPDSVEKICEECFCGCERLLRVTFGASSSLKLIGNVAFWRSSVLEIHIPDSVEELCEECFCGCETLWCVTFGASSSLKLIGKRAFRESGVCEIHLPDSVEELCEECFCECYELSRVTFGASSSLKLIGKGTFRSSGLTCFCLPGSVSSIGGSSFSECPLEDFEICDSNLFFEVFEGLLLSKDQRVCYSCIGDLEEVFVPESVEELCEECFCMCRSLSRVMFGERSSLKLIRSGAFCGAALDEIHIPDCVQELCEGCFFRCESLSRVTFGESSSLKLIGKGAFNGSDIIIRLVEIHIPDRIERLLMDSDTSQPWRRRRQRQEARH